MKAMEDLKLSKNFRLSEVTRSNKAISLGIDNSVPESLMDNLQWFVSMVLQPIRSKVGLPIKVTSWYRCPALNEAVGGAVTSAHLSAMAIDFTFAGKTAQQSFDLALVALKDLRIQFDQLIIEKNTKTGANWVHLGVKETGNRNQTIKIEL